MLEYIFTIVRFDKLDSEDIKLLETIQKYTKKIIIGLYDDSSVKKLEENSSDIDSYDVLKKKLEKYSSDIFSINNTDPVKSIKEYMETKFNNSQLELIRIGSSESNNKIINNDYTGELYFFHNYNDTFKCSCKDNNIIITRTDKNVGWGQNLLGYKNNWCFIALNKNEIPGISYIKSIMPVEYSQLLNEFSNELLLFNKLYSMNYLLSKVVDIMNENNIPYHLDCGTLLGCIRENGLLKKDTDVDISIHLSYWNKLASIDFKKYDLEIIRKNNYPGILSVRKTGNMYCDIYIC